MLLDTHVWIWLVADSPRHLGPKTRRRLAKATAWQAPHVSAVSAFEIAALHTAGRLQFTMPVERWIRESVARAGFRVIDLAVDVAVDAGSIPVTSLADPFDRCLVATAREHQMPLVTGDRRILEYAKSTGLVAVMDAAT